MEKLLFEFFLFTIFFLLTTLASLPNQVEILLAFKNEFPSLYCDPSVYTYTPTNEVTSSWTKHTTSFHGVIFDNKTGAVTELHLGSSCLSGKLKPNSNLFRFQNLRYLDLSFNDFSSSSFPSEFTKLNSLEFLLLHHSGFTGKVPNLISNLTRLTYLDLSHNELTGEFPIVQNLTNLSYLDLSFNHFSGVIPFSLFTTMPFLSILDLSVNHLSDPFDLDSSFASSNLVRLYLGKNLFSGRILKPISKLLNLTHLDLSFLNIIYPINIGFLPLNSLEYLDLSGNSISRFSTFSDHALPIKLIELDLSSCKILQFPKSLKTLKNLRKLDISKNKIEGKVPEWLWKLPSLKELSLSHNFLSGFEGFPEILLTSSQLLLLDLSSNAFQGSFPVIPPRTEFLFASNNHFNGDLPLSLCNLSSLSILDLSNNSFSSSLPGCFTTQSLTTIILRNNNILGDLPDVFCRKSSLTTLDIGHNQVTGKLPKSLGNCHNLEILNVENNRIFDTFPFWLKTLPNLQAIVLRNNRFHGPISVPQHRIPFPKLRILDISRNGFTGRLPSDYFVNWSAALALVSSIPKGDRWSVYMGSLEWPWYQPSMYLTNKGQNIKLQKISLIYTSIDFSGNRFEGQIPESIGVLKSLHVLNLSNNSFTGQIPSSLVNLTKLESLDISRNQLSGQIPQELATLTFLGYIDMSHNKLRGKIPQSTQFLGQSESSFEENMDLCGPPLLKRCSEENSVEIKEQKTLEEEQVLNRKAVVIGYGAGVLFGVAIGQVIASYRPVLFIKLF